MGVIPLTSILSHKGRGGYFHPSVALHRSMKARNAIILPTKMYSPEPIFTYPGQLLARRRLTGMKAGNFTLDRYKPVQIFIKENLLEHLVCHVQQL